MKATKWNLIVISPESPSLQKIRISSTGLLIIVGACVLAFCTTVFLLLMFPHARVQEMDRSSSRLAAENSVLRSENKNLLLGIHKLDSDVSRLEGHSKKVVALAETD